MNIKNLIREEIKEDRLCINILAFCAGIFGYDCVALRNVDFKMPTWFIIEGIGQIPLSLIGSILLFNYYRKSSSRLFILILLIIIIMDSIVFFAELYKLYGLVNQANLSDVSGYYASAKDTLKVERDPITCLYFSMVVWSTLGFGDYVPVSDDRLIAGGEALIAYFFMAVIISLGGDLVKKDQPQTNFKSTFRTLSRLTAEKFFWFSALLFTYALFVQPPLFCFFIPVFYWAIFAMIYMPIFMYFKVMFWISS